MTAKNLAWFAQIKERLFARDVVGTIESLDAYLAQGESRIKALYEIEQYVFNPVLYSIDQHMGLAGNVAVGAAQRWLAQRHNQGQAFEQGLAYQAGLDGVYRIDQAVRERVARESKALNAQPQANPSTTSEYMDQPQAAVYLNMSKPTLLLRRRMGLIPAFEAGRRKILYRKADLDAYLMSKQLDGK